MNWRGAVAAVVVAAGLLLQLTPHVLPKDVPFDFEFNPDGFEFSPYDVESIFGPAFNSDPPIQGSTSRPASAAGLSQAPAPAAAIIHLPLALALGRPYFDLPGPFELSAEFVLGGPATSVDVVDGVAFSGIGAHLVALDVSGDVDPTALGASPPLPGTVMDVAVRDGFAFVAAHQATPLDDMPGGLFVLDVRRSDSIEIVGHGAIHGGATRLAVEGDRAILVALHEAESDSEGTGAWIHEFDIADADAPSELGRTRFEGELSDFEIAGGSLFACIDGDPPLCHDAVAYVFEIGTSDSGIGRLWALSITDDMPAVSAIMDLPHSEDLLRVGAPGVVASPTGLFFKDRNGQIFRYQVWGGRLEFMGAVVYEGTIAVSGDNLFVWATSGELLVYDVSVPDSWRHVTTLELPSAGRRYYGPPSMIASKNRLWMATTISDPFSTPVILADISDITDVRLIGTLDLATESGEPEYAWLREGEEDVWLMTTDLEFGTSRTAISTLSESPDDSGAVLEKRWISDTTPESMAFPWALAVLEDRAWFVSRSFVAGQGSVLAVEKTEAGHLNLAGTRAAPAAVRARSTYNYDDLSESYGALSLATCGDRIFGTDLEGGLYGIDPERWLEGVGDD